MACDEHQIGNLKTENQLGRISLQADLDITHDQAGPASARDQIILIDGIVRAPGGEKLLKKLPAPVVRRRGIRLNPGS
jgi:hypothetical protein